jgi:hypothetical protein
LKVSPLRATAMFARCAAKFAGSYRLRVGKWRVFVLLEGAEIIAYQIDNRGEAY